jgi:hypothetical protein
MKRALMPVAAAAITCLAAATAAAQPSPSITVCEHQDFRGRCVTLRHGVNDLRDWGISNRISSFRVERGEWLVCTGIDFSGHCEPVRGRVADLRRSPLQDSISSIRPIREGAQGGGFGAGSRGGPRETAIVVYTGSNFRGRSWVFSDDVRDLSRVGLNNQVSSVRVLGGRWQICEQQDFRNCRDVMRDIPDLRDFGMNDRISSIREGGGWGWGRGESGRAVEGRGLGSGRGLEGGRGVERGRLGEGRGWQGPSATLYERPGFGGRALDVRGAIRNLQGDGFNDLTMSIRVSGGRWQICDNEDYRGRCEIIERSIDRLGPGLANRVSSIRPY